MYRLVFLALLVLHAGTAATLQINTVGDEGERVWARFEVRDVNGDFHKAAQGIVDETARASQEIGERYLNGFLARGEFHMRLPAGEYTLFADRGPEYEPVEMTVVLSEEAPVAITVELKRWIRMLDTGWWSADFHVHRPPDDVEKLVLAEDLNLAVVFTMWNKRDLFEGKPLPKNPLRKIDATHWMTLNNAEDERGGGAWMFHNLRGKLPLAVEGRWHPAGLRFISEAKDQRYVPLGFPWFDCEKPFWWEVPVRPAMPTT